MARQCINNQYIWVSLIAYAFTMVYGLFRHVHHYLTLASLFISLICLVLDYRYICRLQPPVAHPHWGWIPIFPIYIWRRCTNKPAVLILYPSTWIILLVWIGSLIVACHVCSALHYY